MKTLKDRYRIVTDSKSFFIQEKGLFGWETIDKENAWGDVAYYENIKFNTKNDARKYLVGMFKRKIKVVS